MTDDPALDLVDHEHCSRCSTELAFRAAPYRWDGTCPTCHRWDVVIEDPGMDRALANSPQARGVMVKVLPTGCPPPRRFHVPQEA